MGPVILRAQSNPRHPFIDQPSILPSADMAIVIDPAWEDEFVNRAASDLQPGQHAAAGRLEELELNGAPGFLLDDDGARPNLSAADQLPDFDLHDITPAQFAVDREIEHRAVTEPPLLIEPEANGPDLRRLQGPLGAKLPAGVPRAPILDRRIML